MAKAFGIEIEDREVRVAVLEGTAKRFVLSDYLTAPVEPGEDGEVGPIEVGQALRTVLRRIKGSRDNTALAVDTSEAIFREHTLPFTGDDRIRQVIKYEVEGKLPHHSIDDVIVDYYVIEEGDHETRLIIAAVPKSELAEDIQTLASVDCDPQLVDLSAFALFNAAAAIGKIPSQGHGVLIHVQEDRILFLLTEDGHLRQVRCLKGGAGTLVRTLERELGSDSSEIMPLLDEDSQDEDDFDESDEEMVLVEDDSTPVDATPEMELSRQELGRDIALQQKDEFLTRITRDLRRTIFSLRLHRRPQVFLSGRFADVPGLVDEVEKIFDREPEALDVLESVEHALDVDDRERDEISDRCAVAMGVGLRMLGVDYVGCNFRQEELKFARTFDLIKLPLLFCLFFVLLAQSLEYIYLLREVNGRLAQEELYQVERMKAITKDADIAYSEFNNSTILRRDEWFQRFKSMKDQIGEFPKLEYIPVSSSQAATRDIARMPRILFEAMRDELKALDKRLGTDSGTKYSMPPSTLDALWVTFSAIDEIQRSRKARIKVLSMQTQLKPAGLRDTQDEVVVKLEPLVYCDIEDSPRALEIFEAIISGLERRKGTVDSTKDLKPVPPVGFKMMIEVTFAGDPPSPGGGDA